MTYRIPFLFMICLGASAVAAACSAGSAPGVKSPPTGTLAEGMPSDVPKPPTVPQEAHLIRSDLTVGNRTAPQDASQAPTVFYSLRCQDGVLIVATTDLVAYAELPCDRSIPDDVVRRFLARPVAIRVKLGNPVKLYVDSAAGSVEFTVGAVWVERPTDGR